MRDIKPQDTARERFVGYRQRIAAVTSVLPVGIDTITNDSEMAELTGMTRGQINVTRNLMVRMGALQIWTVGGGPGRTHWKLMIDGADLDRAIDLEMERQMRGGLTPETERLKRNEARRHPPTRRSAEKVAVSEDRLGFATGAVAGPERPSPMAAVRGAGPDAPAALVMAAKQYRRGAGDEQVAKAQQLVKQLNEMGVSVPPELAEKAAVRKDERLEAVVLVLPYIEALERKLVVANDQLREQADYGTLRQRVETQKHQIERLVADRTADALGARPHSD